MTYVYEYISVYASCVFIYDGRSPPEHRALSMGVTPKEVPLGVIEGGQNGHGLPLLCPAQSPCKQQREAGRRGAGAEGQGAAMKARERARLLFSSQFPEAPLVPRRSGCQVGQRTQRRPHWQLVLRGGEEKRSFLGLLHCHLLETVITASVNRDARGWGLGQRSACASVRAALLSSSASSGVRGTNRTRAPSVADLEDGRQASGRGQRVAQAQLRRPSQRHSAEKRDLKFLEFRLWMRPWEAGSIPAPPAPAQWVKDP